MESQKSGPLRIPSGWKYLKLGETADVLSGFAFKSELFSLEGNGTPLIRGDNVSPGGINGRSQAMWTGDTIGLDKYLLEQGDILIAMDRTWISSGLRVAIVGPKDENAYLVQRVARIRPKETGISSFILAHISTKRFEKYIKAEEQAGGGVPHISKRQIEHFPIPLPSLSEQKKIAEILSTWDDALETLDELIKAKAKQKRGLMQQLLTGKKRLPGFEGEWELAEMSDVFSRVTEKNSELHDNVVTMSAQRGLVRQEDFFNKRVAAETLEGYFLLKQGQFAYNKSYSKGYPMGVIKRLKDYDKGVVTTLYICFELSSGEEHCAKFWDQYFEAGSLNRGLTKVANEGGRAHGLLNVTPSDFFGLPIRFPKLKEQQAITSILDTADQEIALLKQKRKALDDQKRGLMQRLLTGKIRVKI